VRISRGNLWHVRNIRWIQGLAAGLFLCAFVSGQTQRTSSTETPGNIITFDAPGSGKDAGQGTSPQGINDDGEIVGYYKDGASVVHGFVRRSDGAFITFDAPGASKKATLGTLPQGINKNGDVAGYYFTDPNGVRHGFVRHKDGTFDKFDPPGSVGTVARSINDLGEFTGNYVSRDVAHGFLGHKSGAPTTFDPQGSDNTAPQSINPHGEIAGYYADRANGLHGFVRHMDSTYAKFDVPGVNTSSGKGTLPMSINSDGEVVGYYHTGMNGGIHGFVRHANGSFAKFDPPGSITDSATHLDEEGYILRPATAPLSINDDGEIAGYFGDTSGVVHGFVRHKDGTFTTFEAPGAAKSGNLGTFAESINNGGDITGYFYAGANAVLHGFLLVRDRNPTRAEPRDLKKSP
jgi:hypothetical protein